MGTDHSRFRMGRLDHVHIRVPDRTQAAQWYAEHLGFEPVAASDFWATGFEGGPLHISADGGKTGLALFGASEGHPMVPQQTGVAFSVDADTFIAFARSLPSEIDNPLGERLTLTDLVDFDMCWAFDLVDPWGNQYELNCYDYDRIQAELVEAEAVDVVRYWPPTYTRHTSTPLRRSRTRPIGVPEVRMATPDPAKWAVQVLNGSGIRLRNAEDWPNA